MPRRIAATWDRLLHHRVRVEVRAVDDEGEVLDLLMELGRDSWSAIKLLTNLIMNQPVTPERITTDGLGSYATALKS
jgi:putative transposase